jgi:hypothetical protein
MKTSFTERNDFHQKEYGHLLEGVKHRTNDSALNEQEQNKLGILIDSSVKNFCRTNKLPGEGLQTVREAMNVSADAVTFIKTQLPLVRKVFMNSIVRNLVSIQPMSQSESKIHYYDIVRDDDSSIADDVHTKRTYADNVEYNVDSPTAIKNLRVKITGTSISCTEKKLKADWTDESEQDIMAYHGVNIESDLSNALGTEITCEWDRVMLEAMYQGATGGAATFDQSVPAGITYSDKKVWMEGLMEKMIDVDVQIYRKPLRKTNWVVTSPEIGAFLEKMQTFVADPVSVDEKILNTGGRYLTGKLSSRWNIYIDPFFPVNKLLMGFNGSSWLETGFVFSPYLLAYMTPVVIDPKTFTKVRAIMSRAACTLVRPNMFGLVTVSGS